MCGKCAELCPAGANEICGKSVSAEDVIAEAEKDLPFYSSRGGNTENGVSGGVSGDDLESGGITITGGEPAAQAEFSLEIIRLAREKHIGAAIETCGYGAPQFFEKAAAAGCTFLFDIKHLDEAAHRKLTGASNAPILENLKRLFTMNAKIVVRLPLIPGANDDECEFEALKAFLTVHRENYLRAEIIPYHTLGKSKESALGRTGATFNADLAKQRAETLCNFLRTDSGIRVHIV